MESKQVMDVKRARFEFNATVFQENLERVSRALLGPNLKLAPVLKANAYGHGLSLVYHELESAPKTTRDKIAFVAVATLSEARQLLPRDRDDRAHFDILITGGCGDASEVQAGLKPHTDRLHFGLSGRAAIEALNERARELETRLKGHICVNVGLGTLGFSLEEVGRFDPCHFPNLDIVGLFAAGSFPTTACEEVEEMGRQREVFQKAREALTGKLASVGRRLQYYHFESSWAGTPQEDFAGNVWRVGRLLYGLEEPIPRDGPCRRGPESQPCLRLVTYVRAVHALEANEYVGYEGAFRAPQRMLVGVCEGGYADGLPPADFSLEVAGASSDAHDPAVLRPAAAIFHPDDPGHAVWCPLVGRPTMDYFFIDLTPALESPSFRDLGQARYLGARAVTLGPPVWRTASNGGSSAVAFDNLPGFRFVSQLTEWARFARVSVYEIAARLSSPRLDRVVSRRHGGHWVNDLGRTRS
ncbi:MAG: hypothetical protein FJ276_15715 [Planctomycetes bacterium]|nr:hypothetical protein [Planctomycetota bacterium]